MCHGMDALPKGGNEHRCLPPTAFLGRQLLRTGRLLPESGSSYGLPGSWSPPVETLKALQFPGLLSKIRCLLLIVNRYALQYLPIADSREPRMPDRFIGVRWAVHCATPQYCVSVGKRGSIPAGAAGACPARQPPAAWASRC